MRDLSSRTGRWVLLAGAALLVAGCSGSEDADNAVDANALDANLLLDQPLNDASAMESAANAIEPETTNAGEAGNASEMLGETRGGDTGGNVIESNTSAM